jgi:hypothetical protein
MNVWKKLSTTMRFLLLFVGMPLAASAADDGVPFSVVGEQLDHHPPEGWKLAWMNGKADGTYIAEYISEAEDINSWREGYLAIERLEYPPAEVLKEIEKRKSRVADVALYQLVRKAKETCGGQHVEMTQRTNTFNGVYFAVGGGYCDRYGKVAPFGEGSFVAFAEGKSYLFRIQYGWRPKSAQDQEGNVPWRIAPQKAKQYLEAIKAMSLCGGLDQPACRTYPLEPVQCL